MGQECPLNPGYGIIRYGKRRKKVPELRGNRKTTEHRKNQCGEQEIPLHGMQAGIYPKSKEA